MRGVVSLRCNERREKQASAQQTFVFHKPLTNEPPALAGSGVRMRGVVSLRCNERREKQAAAQQTFVAKHVEEAPVTRPLTFHKPLTKVPPKFLSNTTERTYPNEKT